jgi:PRTRC genetic system protein E
MFKEISPILKSVKRIDTSISINSDGSLSCVAKLVPKAEIPDIPLAPFMIKGTAEDIDEVFANEISKFIEKVNPSINNFSLNARHIEEASKASDQKAKESQIKKKPKSTPKKPSRNKQLSFNLDMEGEVDA